MPLLLNKLVNFKIRKIIFFPSISSEEKQIKLGQKLNNNNNHYHRKKINRERITNRRCVGVFFNLNILYHVSVYWYVLWRQYSVTIYT